MTTLLTLALLANSWSGVATQYTAAEHAGNPLYCDRGQGWIYSTEIAPWVAMPVRLFESGAVRCGDLIQVQIEGAPDVWGVAYDAGNLHTRTFRGGLLVVVDVPEHLATWAHACPEATAINWSAAARDSLEVNR